MAGGDGRGLAAALLGVAGSRRRGGARLLSEAELAAAAHVVARHEILQEDGLFLRLFVLFFVFLLHLPLPSSALSDLRSASTTRLESNSISKTRVTRPLHVQQ